MENELNYIKNKPSGKDCFDGKSHEKISESIAEHINNEITSMKVIGLEGEWGSGKSNIIEILKQKLKDTHYIYIYDSWGHQEDSQRRAFLEELTEELVENKLLGKKTKYKNIDGKTLNISWQEKIKYLLARKKETNKKTIPKLSIGLIVVGLLVVLTPILALISNLLGDNTKDILLLKILFSSSLLIVAIVVYFIYSFCKKFCSESKEWASLSSLFYLYKGKELENTTFEILSDLEPSVKEFKDWIKSISDGLTENKKLIIVYDNMDRLPPEKVKEIWSSIHTFFAEEEYENIHIIIPFDRKHLQKAFDTNDEKNETNEFINKTFSLIYRVTPPILTDWKKFFHTKFEEAFKDNEKEELPIVLSIFDRLKQRFTPRDIIVFINELITYKKIWKKKIPLKYIAIFVLQKEIILDNPHKNILENTYLKNIEDIFYNDDNLQNYISALTFNVEVEKASQVLLIRDLELTLRGEENSLNINEFANNINFIDILEEVVKGSELVLDKAIQVLSKINKENLQGENINLRLEKIWDILAKKQIEQEINKLSFSKNHNLLLLNISNRMKNELIKDLLNKLHSFKEFNGKAYFEALKTLDDFIKENNVNFDLQKSLKQKNVESEIFLDYLSIAGENYKTYKVSTDFEKLDSFIANKIPDEIENIHLIDLSNILEECNFNNTRDKIENIISSNKLTENNFYQISTIYKSISEEKPLNKIVSMPNLYKLIEKVTEDNEGFEDLVALRIKYANQYNYTNCSVQHQQWKDKLSNILNSTDEDIVKEVAEQIEYYISYGDLLLLATKWKKTLLKEVCKDLVYNRYGTKRMDIKESLKNFEKIKNTLEINIEDLLKSFDRWTKFAKEEINKDNIQEVITDYEFYKYSTTISLDLTKHLNKVIKEFINNQEQETLINEWNDDDSYIWNSLYILMENEKIKTLPKNIFGAIKKILVQISKSEINIPEDDSIWKFFIEKIDKNKITPTIKDIRDYFIRENNIDCGLFRFFELLFREVGNLNEKAGDVTRTILTNIISDDNCLNMIIENQNFYAEIINKADVDAENFKDIVSNKLNNTDDNSELEEFAKKINVSNTKEVKEE